MTSEHTEGYSEPASRGPQSPEGAAAQNSYRDRPDAPARKSFDQQLADTGRPQADPPDQTSNEGGLPHEGSSTDRRAPNDAQNASDAKPQEAIVVVRGEAVREAPKPAGNDADSKESSTGSKSADASKDPNPKEQAKDKPKEKRKEKSPAKVKLQSRLPALDDDADVGVQKEQVVVRDGKADLAFTGTLLASAAPPAAPKGQWQEYRVYETNGGKHVFSKVKRSVYAEDQDTHEAEVFDPAPSSMPSQLLRSARDLTRSKPLTWMDAAVEFFGYDPLAKDLYRKLSGQFEEHIA